MKRLHRLTAILTTLQSKRVVTGAELAEQFNTSVRTIYRDIRALEEAGVPIGSEAGIGYYLVEGYSLPPVMFTEAEANALITAEKILLSRGELSLMATYSAALTKLKSVLRHQQKEKIEYLNDRIVYYPRELPKSNFLVQVQLAIPNFQVMKVRYHSYYKDETTTRHIEPLAIYFTEYSWAVVAYCRMRKDYREFRLDRMEDLSTEDEYFKPHSDFSIEAYFQRRFND